MSHTLLQDSVPYDQSIKWEIHHRYFQQKGAAAWLTGDIPYYVTCNTAAALQKANMVAAAVKHMEQEGSMRPDEPVFVLEMASGQGLFCFNFIRMLRRLDAEGGTNIAQRLRYFATDYSAKTVHDASAWPQFQELVQEGVLSFGVLDALDPQAARDLKEQPLPLSQLTAVISNYMQDALPLTILRKNALGWHEKHIRLWLEVPEEESVEEYLKKAVEEPVGLDVFKRLTEEEEYLPAGEGVIRHSQHLEVMNAMAKDLEEATLPYPYGSLQNIERTLPLLRKGGIMLHTDKGYSSVEFWRGNNSCLPSLHGNTFAHMVNFPMIQAIAEAQGVATAHTTDPTLSIKTLMIENRPAPALYALFQTIYNKGNANTDRTEFEAASVALEKEGNQTTSLRFQQRACDAAPEDSMMLYRLALLLLAQKRYEESLEAILQCEAADLFHKYDCAFCQGRALFGLGRHAEALEQFTRSTELEDHFSTRFNMGLCCDELKRDTEAKENYMRCLLINPGYEAATVRLKALFQMPS